MNPRIQVGKGVTGAVRYCLGEGRHPTTGELLPSRADGTRRVEWIGGTGFSFEINSEARADLARREMEFDALNQKSRTKKCEQDCVHISLAWSKGETPSREEMEEAGRSALASIGMKNAKALFFAHGDEDYAHLHIVASKINPDTGRAYDLARSWRKLSAWSEQYEREHGGVVNTRRETANELRQAIAARDAARVLEAMTKQRSTFTAAQLERALQKEIHSKIGAPPEQRRSVELQRAQFANAILDHANAVHLCDQPGGPVTRYTTRAVIEAELHVLRAANGLASNTTHGLDDRQRAATLNGARYDGVTREQALAFRHATGAEGLAIIDGQAGTGKSFTLAAVREAYEAAGCRVIGLAPTNKVARKMEADGFGVAKTVHSELFALNNARTSWDPKTVVIVDEAAMLDTKLMAMVTAHAHDAGAKLVLVGDDRQLSSIDRGGMFGTLKDRHGAAELSEVKRQHKIDHRRASEMMGEGNFHDALGIYEAAGNIHWTRTQSEARAELVEKWAKDSASTPHKSRFVFAYTNDDVNELNDALRAVRKGRGELGQDHELNTAHGRASFAAGDRIQFTGTDKQRGIDNGAAGTIEAIDGTHVAVRLDDRNGKIINFDAAAYDKFRHGYAGTIYKGQGDTLDQTYLFHSEHWRSAPAYVALTRHRESTELFVARGTAKDVKELARQVARTDETRAAAMFHQREPIGPVRPMNAAEILAQFAGEGFGHQAERMEREGKHWPGARHYDPRPKPPWPSAREQRRPYQQDNNPPAAELDADDLAERVQRIIDDPTREADEHDERVLQALYVRREETAQPAAAEDVPETDSSEEAEPEISAEQQAIDSAVAGQEMTDDKQAQYSRFSGEQTGAAGQPSRPPEPGRARTGGRSRTR
jgi:Ti-type conjugative transfer relaxase TraA